MKIHSSRSKFIGAGLSFAVLLSACSGTDADSDADDDVPGSGDSELSIGEEFNVAFNANPPTLDPMVTTASAAWDIGRNFFEPLITLDSSGEVQPVLAESFEVSEEGDEITFTLREGVQFHHGETMGAEDVVVSLEKWIERSDRGQQFFSEAEVESREEGQVTVVLPHPMYIATELLADHQIMPASVLEGSADTGVEEYIGTGPYEFVEWATDQYVHMQRFEDYQGPDTGEPDGLAGAREAGFENLYYHLVTDPSTRVAGVQTGEYDAANGIPIDNVAVLENSGDLEIYSGGSLFSGPIFNKAEGLMSDVVMRQAVLAAIEAEAFMQAAFVDDQFYNTNPALMPEDSPWYSDAGQELFHNDDPEVVQDLLDEAGYDGEPVRIMTDRENAQHYDMAIVLQQQLEDHGMNTDLMVYDWPTVTELRDDPEAYDVYFTGFAPTTVPIAYQFFFEGWSGWTDSEEISAAIDDITHAADEEEALVAAEDLQQAFFDYIPMIKPGERQMVSVVREGIDGFDFSLQGTDIYYNMHEVQE